MNNRQANSYRRWIIKSLKAKGLFYIDKKKTSKCKNKVIEKEYNDIYKSDSKIDYKNRLKKISYTPEENNGYVYVFANLNYGVCKIGFSKKPKKRLNEIQTGCPYPLFIHSIYKGSVKMEKKLHKKYQCYKSIGEWFFIKGKLKEYLDNHEQLKQSK